MRDALRTVYGRLLMIPRIGGLFRIPVLTWRALRGRDPGAGVTPAARDDTLALLVAAVDGLRQRLARREEEAELFAAALAGLRDSMPVEARETRTLEEVEGRLRAEMEAQVARLGDRVEFARAEALFELRALHAGGGMPKVPGAAESAPVRARVLDHEKLAAQQAAGVLRLNLGCGHVPKEGYINVDMRELPGVDAVAEAADLPFEPGSVAEIHSAHLLEHFPLEHLRRVVLPHWRKMLRPGGTLRAVVPDAEAMLAAHAAGEMSFDDLREVTYGLQEYEGDFHFNMFGREALAQLLREAGFTDIGFAFQGRSNGKCRDMEIHAVRA